ncbi:MAG: hypothetical protein M1826_005607 [Phylliscum demangeonii]|nr:MAG: hypothetical protein M1826_005607 [Phylliscum demangeonii]
MSAVPSNDDGDDCGTKRAGAQPGTASQRANTRSWVGATGDGEAVHQASGHRARRRIYKGSGHKGLRRLRKTSGPRAQRRPNIQPTSSKNLLDPIIPYLRPFLLLGQQERLITESEADPRALCQARHSWLPASSGLTMYGGGASRLAADAACGGGSLASTTSDVDDSLPRQPHPPLGTLLWRPGTGRRRIGR